MATCILIELYSSSVMFTGLFIRTRLINHKSDVVQVDEVVQLRNQHKMKQLMERILRRMIQSKKKQKMMDQRLSRHQLRTEDQRLRRQYQLDHEQ